ncbi:hypothetical protein, partial [Streptomyces sp. NPDC059489]|uniref:hypothetical protein n=1 Tax=Streptomyces sp. NPDC059489 TaxID=3346849 RepID=UPI0036B1C47E
MATQLEYGRAKGNSRLEGASTSQPVDQLGDSPGRCVVWGRLCLGWEAAPLRVGVRVLVASEADGPPESIGGNFGFDGLVSRRVRLPRTPGGVGAGRQLVSGLT